MKPRNTVVGLCGLVGLVAAALAVPFLISCFRCDTVRVGAFLLAVAAVAFLGALALRLERPGSTHHDSASARKDLQLRLGSIRTVPSRRLRGRTEPRLFL